MLVAAAIVAALAALAGLHWWQTCTPEGRLHVLLAEAREGEPHWITVKVCEWCGWELPARRGVDDIANDVAGIGVSVIPVVAEALNDSDVNVRLVAVKTLQVYNGTEEALDPLIKALHDTDPQVRVWAAIALGCSWIPNRQRAVQPLVEALADNEIALIGSGDARVGEQVRCNAAAALGEVGGAEAVGPLAAALKDADSYFRRCAADALGQIGDAQAVKPLITALGDKDLDVRAAAAGALAKIGGSEAVGPLIELLSTNERASGLFGGAGTGGPVAGCAARALGELGDLRAVKPLIGALSDPSPPVRARAALALGHIGDSRSVRPLMVALGDAEASVRANAALALGLLGDRQAVPGLVAVMADMECDTGCNAMLALGLLGDPQAIPAIRKTMEDSDWPVKLIASAALVLLGQPDAARVLVNELNERPPGMPYLPASLIGLARSPPCDAAKVKREVFEAMFPETPIRFAGRTEGNGTTVLTDAMLEVGGRADENAAEALFYLADPSTRPALMAACKSRNAEIRVWARMALRRIDRAAARQTAP